MPVTITESHNGRVLWITFIDPWTVMQMIDTFGRQREWCAHVQAPGAVIIDLRQSSQVPHDVLRARESPVLKDSKVSCIGTIAGHGINHGGELVRVLADVVLRMTRFRNARFFATEADTVSYVEQQIHFMTELPVSLTKTG